jgi:hypothetical protein
MAKKKKGNWWGIDTADDWRKGVDSLALWCFARDDTMFNRRVVDPERVKKYNKRLLYLLGAAICRRCESLFPHPRCHKAIEVAEKFADGKATLDDLEKSPQAADAVPTQRKSAAVSTAVRALYWLGPDDYKVTEAVELVIDVAGYRAAVAAAVLAPNAGLEAGYDVWEHKAFVAGKKKEEKELCGVIRDVIGDPFNPVKFDKNWRTSTAVTLAKQMYESREFSAMPILADALQDAGCDNDEVLKHCRRAGPHVRGCWAVDGVLGKE